MIALGAFLFALPSQAQIITSLNQVMEYTPDAWTRGNDANTTFYGWDSFEDSGVGGSVGGSILDDSTPDLGIDPGTARFFQGTNGLASPPPPILYGHRSGSGNYYAGFLASSVMDDTITGTAVSSGSGGFTTLVLQAVGQPASGVGSVDFVASAGWTKVKDIYGTSSNGTGHYWQEWIQAGDNLAFSIDMDSVATSYAFDAFTIDTFWTSGSSAAINSVTAVPEPSTYAMMALGLGLLIFARRRMAKANS